MSEISDKIYIKIFSRCWSCFHEVRDEENAGPSEDTRSSLAKFNEQTGPLVSIMQQMNGVTFADHILEPPVPTTTADDAEKDKKDDTKKVLQVNYLYCCYSSNLRSF